MTNTQEELIACFMPPLITILEACETEKGSALSDEEILRIRDEAIIMTLSKSKVLKLEKSRGYRDLDSNNICKEWREYKNT